VDTVAGVLLLVATWLASTAWWTRWRDGEPRLPPFTMSPQKLEAGVAAFVAARERALAREDALLAAAALAVTGVVLLALRRNVPRRWTGPAAALLLLAGAAGTAGGALAWSIARRFLWPGVPVELQAVFGPFVVAPVAAVAVAAVLATRLAIRGPAAEMAAGGVVAWGLVSLGWLVAAPGHWTATGRLVSGDDDLGRLGWSATLAGACLAPAAELLVVTWFSAPPAGRDALVARCRGACAVLAVLLLLEASPALSSVIAVAVADGEVRDWAAPQAALLVTAALCASLAAARWRWAPALVPVAAAAAVAAVAVVTTRGGPPEHVALSALVVTGVVTPVALTACVLWIRRPPATARPALG
jgi:hypothetical protein